MRWASVEVGEKLATCSEEKKGILYIYLLDWWAISY